MNFEIDVQYTLDEYKKFNKVVFDEIYNGRKEKIIAIVVCAMISIAFAILKMYASSLIAIVVFVSAAYLAYTGRNKQIKDAWESNALMKDAIYHYKFSENKMESTSPRGVEILEYDKMYRLIETDTHFYMMIAQNVGFILPKDKCSEEQQNFIRSLK